jgi:hypothetical protein
MPNENLTVQWYYILANETIKTLLAYFQSLFAQRKIDGTLERYEVERLRNRAKRMLVNDIHEKRKACRSNHACRKMRERKRGRYDGSQSHRRVSNNQCDDDRRHTTYG